MYLDINKNTNLVPVMKLLLELAGGLRMNKESVESLFNDGDESGTDETEVNHHHFTPFSSIILHTYLDKRLD